MATSPPTPPSSLTHKDSTTSKDWTTRRKWLILLFLTSSFNAQPITNTYQRLDYAKRKENITHYLALRQVPDSKTSTKTQTLTNTHYSQPVVLPGCTNSYTAVHSRKHITFNIHKHNFYIVINIPIGRLLPPCTEALPSIYIAPVCLSVETTININ